MADDGAALELAIGTGRVAVPLAARGVCVAGVDDSDAMLQSLPPGRTVLPWRAEHEGSSYDVVTQNFSSLHFSIVDGRLEAVPVEFRYAWRSEMDLMARLAGLRLAHRYAGWDRAPFAALSPSHVSVYQKR